MNQKSSKSFVLLLLSVISLNYSCKNDPQKIVEQPLPNIVFILADDLGYGDLGTYGATLVNTPNIDRIAEEGMKFTNAYSPHSVCTPTRYSLMTGRYAWRTWNGHQTVWSNDPLLIDTKRITLPKILHEAGYQTALIGKWHLGFGSPDEAGWDNLRGPDYNQALKPGPLESGFDYFYGIPHVGQKPNVLIENHHVLGLEEGDTMEIVLDKRWLDRKSYLQRIGVPRHAFTGNESAVYAHENLAMHLTEKAVDWIETKRTEPFFLYFAHRNVHQPVRPDPRFLNTSEIGVYGDFIHEFDWSVGEILAALDREGLADNTMVFLASDNGGYGSLADGEKVELNGHYKNGPFFGQKTEVYEGGVHVPLLVRWPGIVKAGSQSDKIVALTDMLATLAEYTGYELEWNQGEDSFSFLYELKGHKAQQPHREHVVLDATSGLTGIRKGSWKLIAGQGGGGHKWNQEENTRLITHSWNDPVDHENPPGQLYNLDEDPGETNNLYYENYDKVVELRALLREIQYSGRSR